MAPSWKDSIYQQREELARMLDQPMKQLAANCNAAWGEQEQLNTVLADGFRTIPHCTYLYCLDINALQISDNIGDSGVVEGHYRRDRSERPYMQEVIPEWGFLLSDAYISLYKHRPSLTALRLVQGDSLSLGYLGADFDLRNLPVTSVLYEEPGYWRQVKGDPAIRSQVFQQSRIESPMDSTIEQSLSILEELLTERGVFQCLIHFSSSQVTMWTREEPYQYRILDHEALSDADICLVYPSRPYPENAAIPKQDIARILELLQKLRLTDETFYLRTALINVISGMICLTFSCDGTHYIPYDEFLLKGTSFWY